MADDPALALEGLTRTFRRRRAPAGESQVVRAVDGVDLEVARGEVFGFLGPNGAGKTTTIRLLLGLLRPEAGRARVLGLDAWHESVAVRRRVGFLPGDVRLWEARAGREIVVEMARLRAAGGGRPACESRAGAARIAEHLGLDLERRVKTYSKGNRQKLGITLALMHDPDLLILDEPSSALDPLVQEAFYELLREFRGRGRAIFFSSHVLSEVEKVCDRVAMIRHGRILDVRAVDELDRLESRRVVLRFGDPEAGVRALVAAGFEPRVSPDRACSGSNEVSLGIRGEAGPMLAALRDCPPLDVRMDPLTLEEVFFDHYREPAEGES